MKLDSKPAQLWTCIASDEEHQLVATIQQRTMRGRVFLIQSGVAFNSEILFGVLV